MTEHATGRATAQIGPERRRAVAGMIRELGDPIRIAVIDLLASGPRTASELADELEMASPRLANHLARLRAGGIVSVTRSGRHAIYRLAGSRAAEALGALAALVPADGQAARPAPGGRSLPAGRSLAEARTCYDHLAGTLGVAVYDQLVAAAAVLAAPAADNSEVTLGPGAAAGFAALGVDIAAPLPRRRKPAVTCLDWTERRPHLGGALGAAVLDSALGRGWVRKTSTRTLTITSAGRAHLPQVPAAPGQSR